MTNFVLFEYLGTIQTVYALVALAGIGVLILDRSRFALVSVVASVGIGLVIPQRYYYQFSDFLGTEKPMLVEETHHGVMTLVKGPHSVNVRVFRTPATGIETEITDDARRNLRDWNFSEFLAIDPTFRPKNILVIGLGNAFPIMGSLRLGFVESIDVVELLPTVVNRIREFGAPEVLEAMSDPRVHVTIADGRRFVRQSVGQKHYDLIQIGTFYPWTSGSSALMSKDFFDSLRRVLTDNGVIAFHRYMRQSDFDLYDLVDAAAMQSFRSGYHFKRYYFFTDRVLPTKAGAVVSLTADFCESAFLESGDTEYDIARKYREPKFYNTDDRPLTEYFLLKKMYFTLQRKWRGASEEETYERNLDWRKDHFVMRCADNTDRVKSKSENATGPGASMRW